MDIAFFDYMMTTLKQGADKGVLAGSCVGLRTQNEIDLVKRVVQVMEESMDAKLKENRQIMDRLFVPNELRTPISPSMLYEDLPAVYQEVRKFHPRAHCIAAIFLFAYKQPDETHRIVSYPYGQTHPHIPNFDSIHSYVVPEEGDPGFYAPLPFDDAFFSFERPSFYPANHDCCEPHIQEPAAE